MAPLSLGCVNAPSSSYRECLRTERCLRTPDCDGGPCATSRAPMKNPTQSRRERTVGVGVGVALSNRRSRWASLGQEDKDVTSGEIR